MQFWTCHYENLDVHDKNLNCSTWKSRPFSMKIWTVHQENLDCWTWISQSFNMKKLTVQPFNMEISTVQHENLNRSSWESRPFIMKISTVHHENLDRSTWNLNFWPKWCYITFDLLLIGSGSRYLLFGVYSSLHQRNTSKCKLQRKPIMK